MLRNEGLCKQGVVAACHVVWEYVVESAAGWVCVVMLRNEGLCKQGVVAACL